MLEFNHFVWNLAKGYRFSHSIGIPRGSERQLLVAERHSQWQIRSIRYRQNELRFFSDQIL